MDTARLFMSGRSQAVRLPKAYRFEGAEVVVRHYAQLRAGLERRGQAIGALDTMIAAHALVSNAILVTNNTREFAWVPGLRLESWV